MKRKMKKKLIAFMLCMVLVICNSVSILADAPAAATTTAENQVGETKTVKNETTSGEDKSSDDNSADKDKDTSSQSDDPEKEESDKAEVPETKTTEKKEETTEATTEEKEDTTTVTMEAEEGTSEAAESSDKEETTGAEDDEASDSVQGTTVEVPETGSIQEPEGSSQSTEETDSAQDKETLTEEEKETDTVAAVSLPDGASVPDGYTEQYTVRDSSGVAVTVYAPEGVVPEGASLHASLLASGSEAYDAAEEALSDNAQVTDDYGFVAMDIHFEDTNGKEVKPDGKVYVVIDAGGILPVDADQNSITVQHHDEQSGSVDVEMVADAGEETRGVVATGGSDVQAAFDVGSFSTFTISWTEGRTKYFEVTVHYVDESGKEINGTQSENVPINSNNYNSGNTKNFLDYANENIQGYTYTAAHYGSYKGDVVTRMVATQTESSYNRTRYLTFYNGNDKVEQLKRESSDGTKKADVYMVYSQNTVPQGMEKVYVYVAAGSGNTRLSQECLDLLGIDESTIDANGYFPAGEIYLDREYFDEKNGVNTPGAPLINSTDDWGTLLEALGNMNTSTLVDQRNWNYSGAGSNGKRDYSLNRDNYVGSYLNQARGDVGYSWGSQHTALFHWHDNPAGNGNAHYGFADQSVKYHLDLYFTTNKITFITGNNGITAGLAKDGTMIDTRTYITGSEIQAPRNLNIPDGYYFDGYYTNRNFTNPWNGIGTPLNKDQTVYIKLSRSPVLALTITKEVDGITVDKKEYSFTISTTDSSVMGKIYTTSANTSVLFGDADNDGTYTATVQLIAESKNGVDGTIIIYGLPTGEDVSYTVKEDESLAGVAGYQLKNVSYTANGSNGDTITTGSGSSAITSGNVDVTNTYEEDKTSVDLIKYGGRYDDNTIEGAVFSLYKGSKNEDGSITWESSSISDVAVNNAVGSSPELGELASGYYKLTEIKAPTGYQILDEDIYFQIVDGKVDLIKSDADGKWTTVDRNETEMWKLTKEGTDGRFTISVKNTALYELPSTGGPGIYWYTLSGTLLMAGAALIVYRQKRKQEVLLKK